MIRIDPPVICTGHKQNGGILRPVGHMMIGRVSVESFELIRVLDRAELGHVEGPVRRKLDPQHVVDADRGDNRPHQIRVLRDQRAHE